MWCRAETLICFCLSCVVFLSSAWRNHQRSRDYLIPGSPDTSLQDLASSRCWSQPLLPGQPINRECLREVIGQCGAHIIQSLFCRSRRLKLYNIMLLHDLVKLTTVSSSRCPSTGQVSLAGAATSVIFVVTEVLSWQAYFCRNKRHVLLVTNMCLLWLK